MGELKERIWVLELKQKDSTYFWNPTVKIWAKVQLQDKTNLFSRVGVGVRTVEFVVRRRPLTLHDAIRWGGKHCVLTAIEPIDRLYMRLTAAVIEPVECTAMTVKQELGINNVLQQHTEEGDAFPAYIIEKYLGYQENPPATEKSITLVLVVPKRIHLETGLCVKAQRVLWRVTVCHELGEYQNEYEIHREGNP